MPHKHHGNKISPFEFVTGLKLSVGVTSNADLLEIEGLFTQGSRPGRTVGDSVDGIFETDSSDWSNGIRHHIFDTRPDTEFKPDLTLGAKCYKFQFRERRVDELANRSEWGLYEGHSE